MTPNRSRFRHKKSVTRFIIPLLLLIFVLSSCNLPQDAPLTPPAEEDPPVPAEVTLEVEDPPAPAEVTLEVDDPPMDVVFEEEALSALLPAEIGYTWIYNGFAEYGHTMTLDAIIESDHSSVYEISGEVADMSGGEGNFSVDLTIKYILSGNSIVQEKAEEMMLDSKFDRLTLIKLPFEIGNTWTETVIDPDTQNEVTLNSEIETASVVDGAMQYTVRYDDVDSDYYELRVIREGVGVISVEKLLEITGGDFPASYSLFLSGMLE